MRVTFPEGKKKPQNLQSWKKCYDPKQVILKLNFYIFIAGRQESAVAGIFRTLSLLQKMQWDCLCIHNAVGVQAAGRRKVPGCARRCPATHRAAFQQALNCSKNTEGLLWGKAGMWGSWLQGPQLAELWPRVLHVPQPLRNCTGWVGCVQLGVFCRWLVSCLGCAILTCLGWISSHSYVRAELWVRKPERCWAMWRAAGEIRLARAAPW